MDESVDREFAKCGFTNDVLVIPDEVEFDLPHQFALHLCPSINRILGDENTSKTAPSDPIEYLVLCPPPLIPLPSSVVKEIPTVSMSDQTNEADALMTLPTTTATSQIEVSASSPPKGEASSNRLKETGEN